MFCSFACRFSLINASRFICSFICEYFLNTFASPCLSSCVSHSSATPPALTVPTLASEIPCRVWAGICYDSAQKAMNITLHIPDSVARSLRIPEAEAEGRLRQELSTALYAREFLSFGKASELAGI